MTKVIEKKENIILEKTFEFSLKAVEIYKYLNTLFINNIIT